MALGSNIEALLTTIMATVATLWAIGFATYYFIFNYLDKWVERQLNPDGRLKANGQRRPAVEIAQSLDRDRCVFIAYIGVGFLSVGTILVAGTALAFAWEPLVPVAGTLFVLTLGSFLVLFTFEIKSSLRYIQDRRPQLIG